MNHFSLGMGLFISGFALACSSSSSGGGSTTDGAATGGGASTGGTSSSSGGSANTGGNTSGSGGVTGNGGTASTGGATSSGGGTATGGSSSTGGTAATGGATGTGGASGCVNLKVQNVLSWCSVTVNGSAPSVAATQTLCVQPGVVDLTATPASSTFKLGSPTTWHNTDNDTGTTSGNVNSTTVTVGSAPLCVWACCPFATSGSGCNPPAVAPCP